MKGFRTTDERIEILQAKVNLITRRLEALEQTLESMKNNDQ